MNDAATDTGTAIDYAFDVDLLIPTLLKYISSQLTTSPSYIINIGEIFFHPLELEARNLAAITTYYITF